MHTRAISTQSVSSGPTRSFGIGHFVHLIFSKAWLIALFAVLSLGAAIIYIKRAPKLYESRAVVEVEGSAPRISNMQDLDTGDSGGAQDASVLDENVKTIEQAMLSDRVLLSVVKANGLEHDPLFAPPKQDGSAYLDSELADRFRKKRVKVVVRHGTRLIDISVKDTEPTRAQQLAEGMVKAFIEQTPERFDQGDRLRQEADGLKAKRQEAEQAVQKYREDYGAVSLQGDQNIVVDKLKELNFKVTDAKSERLKLESDVAIIKQSKDPQELLTLPSIASVPLVISLREQLAALQSKYQAQSQLAGLKQSLNRAVNDAANALKKSYENAKATEAVLTGALHEQEQKALELNKIAIPYNALVREVDADRVLYESVVTRMKVADIASGISGKNIHVIATPLVAAKPIEPAPLRTLVLALLTGITAGCGLVICIDMADNSIRTVDQAERISGLAALAALPESKRRNRKKEPVLTSDPASYEAEAFRSLRTAVSFLGPDAERTTLLFTSANPQEGKSYCALNYSVALAHMGLRTLLVDADIRTPRLSKIVLPDPKSLGLTDCLAGQANAIDCCKPTGIGNLFLLPAGQTRSRPSELFASSDFASLLKELETHFDRIVLDSAPVNAVSDTQLIARYVQSVCFVVRAIKTPAAAIIRACALLTQAGSVPDGIVFNRMPLNSRGHYYFHEYAGGYATGGTKQQKLKAPERELSFKLKDPSPCDY